MIAASTQRGGYLAARQRRDAQARKREAAFAELLAEGFSVTAAASHLGLTQQGGSNLLRRIRAQLGWQAS